MAFYSLVATGVIYGQQWQNQYNYHSDEVGGVDGGAHELVNEFNDAVLNVLRAIWRMDATQFYISSLYAVDVFDDTDFWEFILPVGHTGFRQTEGPAVSPFVSFSFRTERWRVKRNRGYKRFCGICGDDVVGNTYDPGGSLLADIETALDDVLVGTNSSYTPTIAGKELYVPDPEQPLKTAYKYYDSEVVQRAESSGQVVWQAYRLTTQRSRIEGQGQ